MTPLDPGVLTEARSARDRLLELQRDLEKARADYNHAVRRLQAAGGSLREIAENLGLSHQRVHQIVEGGEASGGPLRRARPSRFGWPFERFTRRARQVVVLAQEEAETLGHRRVGTEHLVLGLLRSEDEAVAPVLAEAGVTLDAARAQARELVGEETARRRAPFTRAAKRALGNALHEARALGDNFIGAEHVLLGLLDDERAGAVAMLRALGADPASLREATARRRRSASAG
ncbi:MAG TPA: Clp protease N-terminal domain-containing protein [Thermoleophilaceae bacterium]|jgi:cell division septum initiation protein DivIVA|nr:Clp protease N-terminal domain-containing protein [Thermoleophilaceae bacterium]